MISYRKNKAGSTSAQTTKESKMKSDGTSSETIKTKYARIHRNKCIYNSIGHCFSRSKRIYMLIIGSNSEFLVICHDETASGSES